MSPKNIVKRFEEILPEAYSGEAWVKPQVGDENWAKVRWVDFYLTIRRMPDDGKFTVSAEKAMGRTDRVVAALVERLMNG